MLLSKAGEYGIRAALYLASLEQEGYIPIRKLSQELDISFAFLTKIFQMLNQAGLLVSFRGPNGGVALARPADTITLREVHEAIEGPALFHECVLGLPGCGELKPCPLHDKWENVRDQLTHTFTETTLAEMAQGIRTNDYRLSTVEASRARSHSTKEDKILLNTKQTS